MTMSASTPDFSLNISEVKGVCPAGEAFSKQAIAEKKTPILSCEGPLRR